MPARVFVGLLLCATLASLAAAWRPPARVVYTAPRMVDPISAAFYGVMVAVKLRPTYCHVAQTLPYILAHDHVDIAVVGLATRTLAVKCAVWEDECPLERQCVDDLLYDIADTCFL